MKVMKRKIIGLVLCCVIWFPLTSTAYTKLGIFAHTYKYKPEDVLEAKKFVQKKGYWEGYRDNRLVGYVFLSKDWTKDLLGYSGKHLETLIGMDTKGVLTGVKIVSHSEPIVLIGLKEENYHKFINQYPGKSIKQDFTVGKNISIDAVTGATVTAVVHNAIIFRSARKVASAVGMMATTRGVTRKISKKVLPLTWEALLDSAAIKNIAISSKELGKEGDDIYLDLYFGPVNVPSIGRNVLGDKRYKTTIRGLKEGESSVFVLARGEGSFKGSGYARGGIFDRFNITQEGRQIFFRETDYQFFTGIKAQGAPAMKEGGLFTIRAKDFDPAAPFRLNLVLPYYIKGKKEFRTFNSDYKIPEMFLEQ